MNALPCRYCGEPAVRGLRCCAKCFRTTPSLRPEPPIGSSAGDLAPGKLCVGNRTPLQLKLFGEAA
jgi:hypothetical protein